MGCVHSVSVPLVCVSEQVEIRHLQSKQAFSGRNTTSRVSKPECQHHKCKTERTYKSCKLYGIEMEAID